MTGQTVGLTSTLLKDSFLCLSRVQKYRGKLSLSSCPAYIWLTCQVSPLELSRAFDPAGAGAQSDCLLCNWNLVEIIWEKIAEQSLLLFVSDSQPPGLRFYIKMQMSWRRSVDMIDRQDLGNTAGVPNVEKIKLSICLNGRNSQYEKHNLQILVPSSFSFQKCV